MGSGDCSGMYAAMIQRVNIHTDLNSGEAAENNRPDEDSAR